jgi:hypothetical protein
MRVIIVMLLALICTHGAVQAQTETPSDTVPAAAADAPATSTPASSTPASAVAPKIAATANDFAIAALLLLGLGTVLFTFFLVLDLREGHPVAVETHWGGLGGGVGGWRLSRALSMLIATLVFAVGFSAVALKFMDKLPAPAAEAQAAAASGAAK